VQGRVGPAQLLRSFCVAGEHDAQKCVRRQRGGKHDGHRTNDSCQPLAQVNHLLFSHSYLQLLLFSLLQRSISIFLIVHQIAFS
jgi:hypothetical protein